MKNNFIKQFCLFHRSMIIFYVTFLFISFFGSIIVFPSYAIGNCSTNGVNDASCVNGNVQNLNFGITNNNPWYQSICGDIRQDSGIIDKIPANPVCNGISGAYAIQTQNNYCPVNPGIAFTGNNDASFNQGDASINNWLVGGSFNPEVYKPKVIKTSYEYLMEKKLQSGITSTDITTLSGCSLLSACNLPPNLSHGLYSANGLSNMPVTVNLQGYTFPTPPPNQNYVFLINGDLHIQGAIHVPVGDTVTFSVSGNIYVDPLVGESSSSSTASDIEGFYSADNSFIVNGIPGVCATGSSDNRLNIAGSIVVNAGLQNPPGAFQNKRDLCAQNMQCPAVTFTERPDLILNSPTFIKQIYHLWQEIAP